MALALLISFILLAIEVYPATYTIGSFHRPSLRLGPTEIHIILAVGVIALYWRGPWSSFAGHRFLLFDVEAVVAMTGMGIMFLYAVIKHTVQPYREERLP